MFLKSKFALPHVGNTDEISGHGNVLHSNNSSSLPEYGFFFISIKLRSSWEFKKITLKFKKMYPLR
jgi:hypothetical protein